MSESKDNSKKPTELPRELQKMSKLEQLVARVNDKNIRNTANEILRVYDNVESVDLVASTLSYFHDNFPLQRGLIVRLTTDLSRKYKNYLWASLLMISSGQFLFSLYIQSAFTLQQIQKRCTIDKNIYYFFAKELGIPHYYPEFSFLFSVTPVTNNESRDDSEENISSLIKTELLEKTWLLYDHLRSIGYLQGSIQDFIIIDDIENVKKIISADNFDYKTEFDESPFCGGKRTFNYLQFSAYYGSLNCFKFFVNKGLIIDNSVMKDAIYGGNIDILEICLEKGADFTDALSTAVSCHQNKIVEWIKEKFEQEYSPLDCLKGHNLELLLESNNVYTPECLYYAALSGYSPLAKFVMEKIDDYEYHYINGDTSLHLAARMGFFEMCNTLVKGGCNVNAKGYKGETPLFISALLGIDAMFSLFLREGADFREQNDQGETPINALVFSGVKDSIYALISYGFDINSNPIPPLFTAVVDGNLQMIDFLLQRNANPNATYYNTGESPLHRAVFKTDFRFTTKLIDAGADVNLEDFEGVTPVANAFKRGDPRLTSRLVKKKTNLKKVFKDGKTLMHFAAMSNLPNGVEFLFTKGMNPNVMDKYKRSPMFYALAKGNYEIAEIFLKNGADINISNENGETFLHYFAAINDVKTMEFLIDHKISMDEMDMNHMTPFEIAAQKGHVEAIDLLINKGALFMTQRSFTTPAHICAKTDNAELIKKFLGLGLEIDFKDEYGETMLHCAAKSGSLSVIAFLVNKNADVNALDDNGNTPLALSFFNNYEYAAKLLLDSKADPNTKNSKGYPLMFWCLKADRKDFFKMLMTRGADINILDENSNNLLIEAIIQSKNDWIPILIQNKINKDYVDAKGKTALIYACEKSNEDALKQLIGIDVDVNYKCPDGRTALSILADNDKTAMMKLLIEKKADITVELPDGTTPIENVSERSLIPVLESCLKMRYDINRIVDGENTHLLMAVFEKRPGLVSFLLKNKANTEIGDIHKRTPLYHAALMSEYEIAHILMMNGANPNAQCDDGRTPIDVAKSSKDYPMLAILKSNEIIPEEKQIEVEEYLAYVEEQYNKYSKNYDDFSDDDDEDNNKNDENEENDFVPEKSNNNDNDEDIKYVLKRGGRRGRTLEQKMKKEEEIARKEQKKRIRHQLKKFEKSEKKKAAKREKLRQEIENRIARRQRKLFMNANEEEEDDKEEEEDILEKILNKQPPKSPKKKILKDYNDNMQQRKYENRFSDLKFFMKLVLVMTIIILIARQIKKMGY